MATDTPVITHPEHTDAHTLSSSELPDAKRNALKRLKYIEGHLGGVRRMIEQDSYCVDVLKQTFAVRRAIQKLESVLLEGHLHGCVIEGVKAGRDEDVLSELLELYSLADKR